jgi:hypothetical protein
MRKLWKGVLLGAAVGGAVKVVQEVRGEGTIKEVGPAVAKAAGQAALAGAVVGFALDRRDQSKLRRLERARKGNLSGVLAGAGALAEAARPAFHSAAEVARERGLKAAEAAKPRLEEALEVAREMGSEAAKAARPRVEHAADLARAGAQRAGEAAKAKLGEYDLPVIIAV